MEMSLIYLSIFRYMINVCIEIDKFESMCVLSASLSLSLSLSTICYMYLICMYVSNDWFDNVYLLLLLLLLP